MSISPTPFNYFKCLKPLLNSLGWSFNIQKIYYALPHLTTRLNLVDLRNTLMNLQFKSRKFDIKLKDVSFRILPGLFLGKEGEKLVLSDVSEAGFLAYDCVGKKEVNIPLNNKISGSLYNFYVEEKIPGSEISTSWFVNLLQRFRPYYYHMFISGMVSSLITLALPLFVFAIYDWVIPTESTNTLYFLALGVTLSLLFNHLLYTSKGRVMAYLGARLHTLIGTEVMKQVLALPMQLIEGASVGNQLSRLRQFDSIRELFTGPLAQLIIDAPFVLIFVIVMAYIGGPLALIPIFLALIFVIVGLILLPYLRQSTSRVSNISQERQAFMVETSSNMMSIKFLAAEDIWQNRYSHLSAGLSVAQRNSDLIAFFAASFSQIIMKIAGIVTIVWGAVRVMDGQMSVGALIAVVILVWRALAPLQTAFMILSRFDMITAGISQLNRLMSLPTERRGEVSASAVFEGLISFKGISFRYPNESMPALQGITMTLVPGETVAIIGENGSGKSTMIKLLLAFYQPQVGSIALDGIDIRQFDPIQLRQSVAYAPQYHHFFRGTIAQNLRLSLPEASMEQLYNAANDANILKDILDLPKGFDTLIKDHLMKEFSSGFHQKLNIARAFLRDSKILILDEPGSNLDLESDRKLIKMIRGFQGKKTIVLITHRPSMINISNKVLALKSNGQMHTFGPRQKVMEILRQEQANAR